jgi:hypothetical protein
VAAGDVSVDDAGDGDALFGGSVFSGAEGWPARIELSGGPRGSVFLKLCSSLAALRARALRSSAATALSDKRASSALKVWLQMPQRAMPPLALT